MMKKTLLLRVILSFCLVLSITGIYSQGLEDIIVEKYYISDANDATDTDGGSLVEGSVTYRIYVDMLPDYQLQAVYGDVNHELFIATSTEFFNNEDRGEESGELIDNGRLDENTVALDSWVSMGGASDVHLGILKADDTDGSVVGGTNNDGGSEGISGGLLVNDSVDAGLPLTTSDGLVAGTPATVTAVGLDLSLFADINSDDTLNTNDGAWACVEAAGATGPDSENRVLIAQLTTNGELSFKLNIQIRQPDMTTTELYVADNPVGDETEYYGLTYPRPGCISATACNYDTTATTDDGSCVEPVPDCWECDGDTVVIVDTDGDGICDAEEIEGCTSYTACNYDPDATDDDGSCIEPVADCWECNENNDGLVIIDWDGDGICNAEDDSTYGLESIIVEKYYISDANDATDTDGGSLTEGSVTFRVYVDMHPDYQLQAVFGDANHSLNISTTTPFFNNEDRGEETGELIPNDRLDENTVALDSWVSMGGASDAHFGILKVDDPDGSIVGGVNNDGGSEGIAGGLLVNDDAEAGIPLTTSDGLTAGTPPTVTAVGLDLSMLDSQNSSTPLISNNGAWACVEAAGAMGPTDDNRVLIAQITTAGNFSFHLNIQIRQPDHTTTEIYVASNPVGDEIEFEELIYDYIVSEEEIPEPEQNVNVFPVPADGEINLQILSPEEGSYSYSLCDVTGKIIMHNNIGSVFGNYLESIDISSVPKGIYIFNVWSEDGFSAHKQIVIN